MNELKMELAQQDTFKVGDFELPGLAYASDGSITTASLIDLVLICLASMENPKVDEVLKANSIILKDKNGKLFFPRRLNENNSL